MIPRLADYSQVCLVQSFGQKYKIKSNFATGTYLEEIPSRLVGIKNETIFYSEVYIYKTIVFYTPYTKVAVSQLTMVRFSICTKFPNLWVNRHLRNKSKMLFYFFIGPKIGTSVSLPSYKSTEHGLRYINVEI